MAIVRWSPWPEVEAMERRMRRLFDDGAFTRMPLPNTDVYETEEEFVVELEVPGFDEKELEIEVHDQTLSVKGERTEEQEKEEKDFQLRERLESRFERRFVLPPEADTNKLNAVFSKGVLAIHAGKRAEPTAKKIAIGAK